MAFVSGVVLAAGRSSRLGRPKQLLDLGGQPLLTHVLEHARGSGLSETILVLGNEAERISVAVGDHGQRTVVNPDFAEGQGTSLRAGVAALDPAAEAALILLGDQPQIDASIIDALIEGFETTGAEVVMPSYGETPGNPVLFARSLFPQLLAVTGDQGARFLVRQRRDVVHHVPFPSLSPPRDVDTEADYAALLALWAGRED